MLPDLTTCLCNTARALTTVREVAETAEVIVHQASELTGADLTFVALAEEPGACRVRASRGAVSQELARSRLPDDLDRVVSAEALMSVRSSPLVAGDTLLGFLYTGLRSSPPIGSDQPIPLGTYAAHAAAALESAIRYEASGTLLRDLTASYAAAESALHRARKQARAHELLTGALLGGGAVDDLVSALADAMGASVWLLGPDGDMIAASDPAPDPGQPADIVVPVSAAGVGVGALALVQRTTVGARERRMLEQAAEVLGLLLSRPAGLGRQDELPREILSAQAAGRHLSGVLVVATAEALQAAATTELQAIAGELGGVAGHYRGWPTLLLDTDDIGRAGSHAQQLLSEALKAPVLVCAHRFEEGDDLAGRGHGVAARCCRLLHALGVDEGVATTDEIGVYALLFSPEQGHELREFLDRLLGPLMAYDARRGTELVATVASFFRTSGNNVHTARALGVHLNTVLKRFARIDDLIGPDWRSPERALELQLAVRIHQIADGIRT